MKVFITGIEGYLGWSLACHLSSEGHQIGGLDMGHRDRWVKEMGSQSAIPISPIKTRLQALESAYRMPATFYPCDMRDGESLCDAIHDFQPDAVVHLAEQPSAPFSMMDRQHSVELTQLHNIAGSLNLLWAIRQVNREIHLVKLGTMGEYGTPGIPIPEGVFPEGSEWVSGDGGPMSASWPISGLQFPRDPGSFYHASKVMDTTNTVLACKLWGLRATDVMQGVVYGTRIEGMCNNPFLRTRFDFDEAFGTAINRFCAQVTVGAPITPYGKGGQKRGFLPLRDSMACLSLLLGSPAAQGEYRVVNQFAEIYQLGELAERVATLSPGGTVQHLTNPRKENEDHEYEADCKILPSLGYEPSSVDIDAEIKIMLNDLEHHADRINECSRVLTPTITWDK